MRKSELSIIAAIALVVVSSLYLMNVVINQEPWQARRSSSMTPMGQLKIIDVNAMGKKCTLQNSFPCGRVRVFLRSKNFSMCTYTEQQDPLWWKYVVETGQYWEPSLVIMLSAILQLLTNQTTGEVRQFIDIGAHLGTYTLAIAHAGVNVVAIEPNLETLRRLATSIYLGNLVDRVCLLHNAVSNKQQPVYLAVSVSNVGDTFLVNHNSCKTFNEGTTHKCPSVSVQSIVLNDLIPLAERQVVVMKVDTQNSEIKIFNSLTASEFFRRVDVVAVQMEWETPYHLYPQMDLPAANMMLAFFRDRGYIVYDIHLKMLPADWSLWYLTSPNIIFMKNRYHGKVDDLELIYHAIVNRTSEYNNSSI